MKRLALVLAALAVIAVSLLAWTPAALVLPRLLPPALSLQDVRGTLWQGQAGQVHWHGRPVGHLDWNAAPAALLRGEFDARLRLSGAFPATARLRLGLARIHFEQVHIDLPAHWLDGVLATPALQPRGHIELTVTRARLERGEWRAIEGHARWQNASLTGVAAAPLGNLHADFSLVAPKRIEGRVHDEGGPLALDGHFDVAAAGYRVQATLAARDRALLPALEWLGQPVAAGRLLKLHGPLRVPIESLATY